MGYEHALQLHIAVALVARTFSDVAATDALFAFSKKGISGPIIQHLSASTCPNCEKGRRGSNLAAGESKCRCSSCSEFQRFALAHQLTQQLALTKGQVHRQCKLQKLLAKRPQTTWPLKKKSMPSQIGRMRIKRLEKLKLATLLEEPSCEEVAMLEEQSCSKVARARAATF